MTERIDHAAEAKKHIDWAHEQQKVEGEFDFTVRDNALIAQAEATLALVEQQRIANILAIACADVGEVPLAFRDLARRGLVKAGREGNPRDDIREGLGL